MLPEIPGVKSAVFTGRICAYNETFSPIGKGKGKSYAMLCQQKIAGRNDEDIVSTFHKFLYSPVNRDKNHTILWMDNCSAQNKNWMMFSVLVALVNGWSESALDSITLTFIEAGYSYMSADLFHNLVEKESKKQVRLYDVDDYLACVDRVESAMKMQTDDFKQWKNQLSQGKASKNTRPLLANVGVAQFR